MKRITLLFTLLTIGLALTFGQAPSDTIIAKKVFGGYQFSQGEKTLTMNQLVSTMETNEQAYKQIKAAKSSYSMAMVFSYAGGFMVGWPIGTAIGGGEPNWALAGIGAGLIMITIPINQSFNKKAKLAIDTYNEGLQTSSFWDKSELKLSVTGNGMGLTLNF